VEAPPTASFEQYASPEVALGLLQQAMLTFEKLRRCGYSLLRPQWPISLIRASWKFTHNYEIVETPLTLLLGDLSWAALTVTTEKGLMRVYNSAALYKGEKVHHREHLEAEYVVPGYDWQEERRFALRGAEGAVPQLDGYILVVQLMLLPGFLDSLLALPDADNITCALFHPNDFQKLKQRIEALGTDASKAETPEGADETDNKTSESNKTPLGLLRGLTLRPNPFLHLHAI